MRNRNRSRLSRQVENQSKKSILVSVVGIIIILGLIIQFGIPVILNASLFVSGDKSEIAAKKKSPAFVAPPVLASLPTATNSARIKIEGKAAAKQTISLSINGSVVDKKETEDNGDFSFPITLEPGTNTITATTKQDDKESKDSNIVTIAFITEAPTLSVDSPSDNQSFSKDTNTAAVTGTTDPGVKVTVNDLWAIVDSDGKFTYNFHLQSGENIIKIVATDDAGNKTEIEKKVTYSE